MEYSPESGLPEQRTISDAIGEDRIMVSFDPSSMTPSDLRRAYLLTAFPGMSQPIWGLAYMGVIACALGALVGLIVGAFLRPHTQSDLIGNVCVGSITAAAMVLTWLILGLRQTVESDNGRSNGHVFIAASPKDMTINTLSVESRVDWRAGQRFFATPRDLILILDPRTRYTHVIPRRLFDPPEAADDFLEACRRWHAAATQPIVKEFLPFD